MGLGAGVGAGASGDSSGFFGAARRAIGAVGVGGALGFAASLAGAGEFEVEVVPALAGRGVGSGPTIFDFVASADTGSGGFASALEVVAETAGVAAEEIFVGKSPEDLALSRRLAGAGESSDIFGNSRGMLRLIRSVFRSGIESSDRWGAGFSSGLFGAGKIGAARLAADGASLDRFAGSEGGGVGDGFAASTFGTAVAGPTGASGSVFAAGRRVKGLNMALRGCESSGVSSRVALHENVQRVVGKSDARPHPSPLPRGEGEMFAAFAQCPTLRVA